MGNPTNKVREALDAGKTWGEFLSDAIGDGTVNDLFGTAKVDQNPGQVSRVPWGQVNEEYLNLLDDAVQVMYEDLGAELLDWKDSVRVATTAALPACTLADGVLTADANGVLPTIDTVTLIVGEDLLVKSEGGGTSAKNGIYTVTSLGSVSTPWILTRRGDADADANVTSQMTVPVSEGAAYPTGNANTVWRLSTNDPIVLDTTALTFTPGTGTDDLDAVTGRGASTANSLTTGTLLPNAATDDIGSAANPWDDGFFGGAVLAGGAAEADGAFAINDFVAGALGTDEHGATLLTSQFGSYGVSKTAGTLETALRFDATNGRAWIVLAGVEKHVFYQAAMFPKTTNQIDIGLAGTRYKDGYFAGVVYADGLSLAGNAAIGGFIEVGGTDKPKIVNCTGTPEGAVAAPVGSIALRDDGGTDTAVYRKETGAATNTGWVAIAAAGGGTVFMRFKPTQAEYPSTNYPTPDERNNHPCLDFDDTADETCYFSEIMHPDYTTGYDLDVTLIWSAETAVAGDVRWYVDIERIADGGQDIDSDGFSGNGPTVDDTTDGTCGKSTYTQLTINGSGLDGIVAGELFRLQVSRAGSHANDTMSDDAELLGVLILQGSSP